MFKRISEYLKGKTKEQPPESDSIQDDAPETSTQPTSTPASEANDTPKSELWSWGLLTGTYNPLTDDSDEDRKTQASKHSPNDN